MNITVSLLIIILECNYREFEDYINYIFNNFKTIKNIGVCFIKPIDENDLKDDIKNRGIKTYRSILIDGEELEFSDGFTDLHSQSYQSILNGNGFTLEDSRKSIELSSNIMSSNVIGLKDDYHPYLKNIKL
jgi:UDP-N-acetyl-2-amino-2-deoxyglucuronate dehydrogenase